MMQKNDIVTVYEDPITKKKPEGKAKLLRCLQAKGWQDKLQYWKVRFLSDGFETGRMVG